MWTMTDGKQSDIKELNKLEVFEFYARLETYEDSIENKKKAFEKQRRKIKK
jgi:hypothetical protein